jgi:hypothetical protein
VQRNGSAPRAGKPIGDQRRPASDRARIFRPPPRQRRRCHELQCDFNHIGVRSFVLSGAPEFPFKIQYWFAQSMEVLSSRAANAGGARLCHGRPQRYARRLRPSQGPGGLRVGAASAAQPLCGGSEMGWSKPGKCDDELGSFDGRKARDGLHCGANPSRQTRRSGPASVLDWGLRAANGSAAASRAGRQHGGPFLQSSRQIVDA